MPNNPLKGRRALVTGGTRGIGAAIAARLVKDGAQVTVTGTQQAPRLQVDCDYRMANFEDRDSAKAFSREILELDVDILINNAGINRIAPFHEIDPEDFERIQLVNLHAPFLLCKAAVPGMCAKGWGRIVNITSVFGVVSKEFRAAYSASKFALDGMTAALAAEVAAHGVLANCVAPGFIDTELTRTVLGEAGMARMTSQIPLGRLGKPDEIAALVSWLVGPENTYISGQTIVIDGGFTRV